MDRGEDVASYITVRLKDRLHVVKRTLTKTIIIIIPSQLSLVSPSNSNSVLN